MDKRNTPEKDTVACELVEQGTDWRSPTDVARAIQKVFHDLMEGKISHQKATSAANLLRVYLANAALMGVENVLPDTDPKALPGAKQ